MTQIDRDGRAAGRVDSAITVAIRSAGRVNEGAETLKAGGRGGGDTQMCSSVIGSAPRDPAKRTKQSTTSKVR